MVKERDETPLGSKKDNVVNCYRETRRPSKIKREVLLLVVLVKGGGDGRICSIAERLGDLLIQEVKVLHGVSEQVELMQIELELMQGYLEYADKRQIKDKRVRTWVSKIREATYNIEDVIETFALKIASRRREGSIQSAFKRYTCIINEAAELHKVGSEIEAIKTKISHLTRCLQTYGIKHTSEGEGDGKGSSSGHERHGRQWRAQSYNSHLVDQEYTVGLEEDKETLAEKLVNKKNEDGKNYGVVSICGLGGLDKTALAKRLYNHKDITHHFDGLTWASISQQCQTRNVLEGILFELIYPSKEEREKVKGLRDEELAKKLYEVQQEKKCLVILDDIWSNEDWDSLHAAFPIGKTADSKILVTSRNDEVAKNVDSEVFLHQLKHLNDEGGWQLLQKKAFPGKVDSGSSYTARNI